MKVAELYEFILEFLFSELLPLSQPHLQPINTLHPVAVTDLGGATVATNEDDDVDAAKRSDDRLADPGGSSSSSPLEDGSSSTTTRLKEERHQRGNNCMLRGRKASQRKPHR